MSAGTTDWLPTGWIITDKKRRSGLRAGSIDKYYIDPVSCLRFRSKSEVLYFLENGTKRKRTKWDADAYTPSKECAAGKNQRSTSRMIGLKKAEEMQSPGGPEMGEIPEAVTWVLTDACQGMWYPLMGDEKAQDSSKKHWAAVTIGLLSNPQ